MDTEARVENELGLRQSRYGFEVGGLRLVAPANALTEAVAKATIYPIPKSAQALVGVINHRGTAVPIFDIAPALSKRPDLRLLTRDVLVFGQGEHSVGMLMSLAPELLELRHLPQAIPKPSSHLVSFLSSPMGTVQVTDTVWWNFDYQGAFKFLALSQAPVLIKPDDFVTN
jgi:chemotaxis signal transduction protein